MTTLGRMWPTPRADMPDTLSVAPSYTEGRHGWAETPAVTHRLTSSLEDSPASPSAPPESDRARQMTAISGLNCIDLFHPSGPVGAFLRTCLGSSAWKVGLTGYSLTWRRAATPAGRLLFRLRLSVPSTEGIASGLWPTPWGSHVDNDDPAQELARKKAWGRQHQRTYNTVSNLSAQVQLRGMWPTPRVEGFDAGKHRGQADSLHSAVKMLPTPTATAEHVSDMEHARLSGQQKARMKAEGHPFHADTGGMKLSAAWVTRLMGFPDGWLDDLPSDPLGRTESSASRRTRRIA